MLFRCFVGITLATNCYLVGDDQSGEAIVVDAPDGIATQLQQVVAQAGLRVLYLINTHCHVDHILGNAEIQAVTDAPIAAHRLDAPYIEKPSSSVLLAGRAKATRVERLLDDGDEIKVGSLRFVVLHTPGHTPGSICLHEPAENLLLSGDTLFPGGYGRCDTPRGDRNAMFRSIRRLALLPPETRVCPGHGLETTLGAESYWITSPESL